MISELLSRNPELYPSPCTICPHDDQRTYWRTYTNLADPDFTPDPALALAIHNSEFSEDGARVVDSSIVNRPGALWSSTNPAFALAVGIARGIMKDRTIHLVGLNYCRHDANAGIQSYEVFGIGEKRYKLVPIGPDRDYYDNPFTEGTIFPYFSRRQIETSTHYFLSPQFLVDARKKVQELFQKFQKAITVLTVSQELNSALNIYFGNNKGVVLELLLNDQLLVTSVAGGTSAPSPSLLDILEENISHKLYQEARMKAFSDFGGVQQLSKLKSEYLSLLAKVEECSPVQKEQYVRRLSELYVSIHEWDDI